jgi:aminobenzoyl-glutamate transport protein
MTSTASTPPARPAAARRGALDRFLGIVEKAGNALPHPATLFALAASAVVLLSEAARRFGLSAVHPKTGELVTPVSLASVEGIHRMLGEAVTNFTSFAPLGTVLVAMIGIGVAEGSGLLGVALRRLVLTASARSLTPIVVFAGIMSNTAGEIGYVLLLPLSAQIFLAAGRHPIAGLAAAFAGVSGGYSANLLLGTIDPLLAGLTQEAARIVDPGYVVNPACNYYFLAVSTVMLTLVGTLVTERIVVPRLGAYDGAAQADRLERLNAAERRGLRFALGAALGLAAVVLAGLLPANGFLREIGTGGILHSPVLSSVVAFIFLGGTLTGIAYGVGAGTIRRDADVARAMGKALETLGGYMVLVFFAAQFVAYFNWTRLGLIFAVDGADLLRAAGLPQTLLMVTFIALSALINLSMGSASAKWAILAPVFVPMFMLLGWSPEVTQAAYRVGDSVTNVISPMMTYFALIISFVQRYLPKAGMGTVIATMLPYSLAFFVSWSLLFVAWTLAELPVGPGAPLAYPAAP